MAKPPRSTVYGRVHCATVIRFTKREEQAMLKERRLPFFADPGRGAQRPSWRDCPRW